MSTGDHEHVVDKSGWGSGPWQSEPDKLQFVTEVGLPGLIVRGPGGALCGYVAVNPDHPWHGVDYGHGCTVHYLHCEEKDSYCEHSPESLVNVHGGLTYSDVCQEDGVCHVPAAGEPADVWWFGFDCAHFRDFAPGMYARERVLFAGDPLFARDPEQRYRDIAYVRAEVESLARQIVDLAV